MINEEFRKLRAKDTITVNLRIVEFDYDPNNPQGQILIAATKTGDRCFVRPADILEVANSHVKVGDCVDYRAGHRYGAGWGVVQSVITEASPDKGTRWVILWQYNERDTAPVVIRESSVLGRKSLPEGYEWPRKVPT